MRAKTKRMACGLVVIGGVALLGKDISARGGARPTLERCGRPLRHASGRLHGFTYRLRRRRPDPNVGDLILADRIRSSLGPLEKRLDLPHIHVMVHDHIATLHGEVGSYRDVDAIDTAVAAVSGVKGVDSYLHVGLLAGDTRPSAGRGVDQPSDARCRLLGAAVAEGLDPAIAPVAVRAILATFAERLPDDERNHVAAHLPPDVRAMFSPPRRTAGRLARTKSQLVDQIVSVASELPRHMAIDVTSAVIRELRTVVPDEAADVAAVLPVDLREFWEQGPAVLPAG